MTIKKSDEEVKLLQSATIETNIYYNYQPLKIPSGWTVMWNNFLVVNPLHLKEDAPEWTYFDEDMSFFKHENTKIGLDLGWYGGWNKNGFYRAVLFREPNFDNQIQTFSSQDINEITNVVNYLFTFPFRSK